jgi:hypothetical protein
MRDDASNNGVADNVDLAETPITKKKKRIGGSKRKDMPVQSIDSRRRSTSEASIAAMERYIRLQHL